MVWENVDGNVYRAIIFFGKFLVPSAGVNDLESGGDIPLHIYVSRW